MAVYCFYLFDRSGRLLCYREWCRARRTHAGEDDAKSMFGLLFALRNFCSKLSPSPLYVWDSWVAGRVARGEQLGGTLDAGMARLRARISSIYELTRW